MENLNVTETSVLRLDKKYLLLTVLLFIIEVLIAVFVRDKFIRPYVGDFLVVVLIYCFFRSFLNVSAPKLAIAVLLFSYIVEFSQYFQLIKLLGLQHSTAAKVILGNSFAWMDILAYTIGIIAVVCIEQIRKSQLTSDTLHTNKA